MFDIRLSDFTYVTEKDNTPDGKIILVGMMEDGPVGRGFTLNNASKVNQFLGENEITRAFKHLLSTGIQKEEVILYRLNGAHSRLVFKKNLDTPKEFSFMELMSLTGSDYDNDIEVTVSNRGLLLRSNYESKQNSGDTFTSKTRKNPVAIGARKEFNRTYLFEEYPTLAELADSITNDAVIGFHNIIANAKVPGLCVDFFLPEEKIPFSHGTTEEGLCTTNGIYPENYIEAYADLFKKHVSGFGYSDYAVSEIIRHQAEIIYFPDMPVAGFTVEKNKNFKNSEDLVELSEYQRLQQLEDTSILEAKAMALIAGRIAKQKTEEQSLLCTALFRTAIVPKTQTLLEEEYMNEDGTYYSVSEQMNVPFLPNRNKELFVQRLSKLFSPEDREEESSLYIQIVVGENEIAKTSLEDTLLEKEELEKNNFLPGATYYASEYLRRSPLKSLMNKQLTGYSQINSEFSKALVATLSANGYICIVPSIRRGFVPTRVQSISNRKTFVGNNFYHFRLMGYIKRDLATLLNKYIGSSESLYTDTDIESQIKEYLSLYQEEGIVRGFSVSKTDISPYYGEESIDISLQMYNETTSVKASVSVKEEGWNFDLWELNN